MSAFATAEKITGEVLERFNSRHLRLTEGEKRRIAGVILNVASSAITRAELLRLFTRKGGAK